jgi:hypothetical protein
MGLLSPAARPHLFPETLVPSLQTAKATENRPIRKPQWQRAGKERKQNDGVDRKSLEALWVYMSA